MWIHPGISKTGTTSIQEAGFRYLKPDAPVRYFPKTWDRRASHVELIPRHPGYDKAALTKGLEKISSDARDSLISCELIHLDVPLVENIVSEIKRGFEGDIRVIITLRSPSDWYPSRFAQKIKTGNYLVGQSFDEFVDITAYPGFAMVDLWKTYVGDKVDVVPYQKPQWVEKFYSFIGLSKHHFERLDVFENRSLNPGQLKQIQKYDLEHGNLGDKAREHRRHRDVEAAKARVTIEKEKFRMSESARKKIAALDQRFEQELERYNLSGFI